MGKRKPMTAEQKKAAGERLSLAREKRLKANPPQYKNIHPSVLELDDSDKMSMQSIKGWIKHQRDLLKTERYNHRKGDKKALAKLGGIQGYIRQLQYYLENGDYVSMYFGEDEDKPVVQHCLAMAYDEDGYAKRTIGVIYNDIGAVWTKEMDDDKRGKF
jgi:hypothetical protein